MCISDNLGIFIDGGGVNKSRGAKRVVHVLLGFYVFTDKKLSLAPNPEEIPLYPVHDVNHFT